MVALLLAIPDPDTDIRPAASLAELRLGVYFPDLGCQRAQVGTLHRTSEQIVELVRWPIFRRADQDDGLLRIESEQRPELSEPFRLLRLEGAHVGTGTRRTDLGRVDVEDGDLPGVQATFRRPANLRGGGRRLGE